MQQLHKTTFLSSSSRDCAAEILEAVPPVMRFIRTQMRRHRGADLSIPQFRTLLFLDQNPGTSLSMLAEYLGISLPATSRLIEGLVRKSLVARRIPSDNRRLVALSISPRGLKTVSAARRATVNRLAEVVVGLGDDERAAIRSTLHALRRGFQSALERDAA